jgi:PAS domain S-box-containing protein
MGSVYKGVIVFLVATALTQMLAYQRYLILERNQFEKAIQEANTIKDRLQASLSYSLSATKTLAFIVDHYGVPEQFDSIANSIIQSNRYIDALQLTRKGVITHVYPRAGNESVIGFDVLSDSLRAPEAFKAIQKGELYFAGPFELKQGGRAVVGRLPLYNGKEFTGFSVVIIKLPTLLRAAGLGPDYRGNFTFQLSKVNEFTHEEEHFLPSFFPESETHVASIDVPDGEWKLYVRPKNNMDSFQDVIPLSILGLLLSATAGIFVWYIARQPDKLNKLVKLKTTQADKLNRLYHFTSRINHLMAHLSSEQSVYEEVCKIAVEIGEFKMAWVGIIDQHRYVHAVAFAGAEDGYLSKITPINVSPDAAEGPCARVVRTNAYVHCNEIASDPLMGQWAKDAIRRGYRSSILLPIRKFDEVIGSFNLYSGEVNAFDENEIKLLQEATDDISFTVENIERGRMLDKAAQQMRTEKILTDSMINSLPGIFYLYDRAGKFVRWNKNFEIVSGYTSDEIPNMHPIDFFHESEKMLLKERIERVFDDGYADVTADFFTKEKKRIPYFFNGRKINFDAKDYLIGMGIDISERVTAEKQLMERADEVSKLTEYLQNVREEERTNIAREIHDVLGQQLTGLKIDSAWIRKRIESDAAAADRVTEMMALIDDTIKTVRRLSSELRPGILDDLGLVAALEWQSADFEKRTGIKTVFRSTDSDIELGEKTSTNIFRVYQESLTNVARHAQASEVLTSLALQNDSIVLTIQDNGIGFNPDDSKHRKSLGLIGMRERARMMEGELRIEPDAGKGTIVTLRVPYNKTHFHHAVPHIR